MLPRLKTGSQTVKRTVLSFTGYSGNAVTGDGELSDMKNLSSAEYPCLVQRGPREELMRLSAPTGLFAKGKLCAVNGTSFLYDGVAKGTVTAGKKQFASIGPRVLIFPDKAYYHTTEGTFGSLEKSYASAAGQITFTGAGITTTGADFTGFSAGDSVKISGCTVNPENNKTAIIRDVAAKTLTFSDNAFTAGTETGAVTVKREVPDLDFVCESGNRVWGCKGSEIFACKLGDPFNWYVYDGLSTDSYAATVGTDGDFTGCVPFSTHIVFFKEDYIHKLYGSKPANFQYTTAQAHGLQAGCEKSLQVIDDILYYKSRIGIMGYSGGVPELISQAFGTQRYGLAVGGSEGTRYYVSLQSGEEWTLFCFDTLRGIWMKEDDTHATEFAYLDGRLHYIEAEGGRLIRMGTGSEVIEWSATTGEFSEQVAEKKGYSTLMLRLELSEGGWLEVEVNPDRTGWQRVYTGHNPRRRSVSIPIRPGRCDVFQIRISGKGSCRIFSLIREFKYKSGV